MEKNNFGLNLWVNLKKLLMDEFENHYKKYKNNKYEGSKLFLNSVIKNRNSFLNFTKVNNLNYGSFAGLLLEWSFKFAIDNCILLNKKENELEVINKYKLPYKWKEKGTNYVNIDAVLKLKKSTKVLICLEIKTNFEDGFSKYYKEQNLIYHHRKKTFSDFKYHYIAFSKIPSKFTLNLDNKRKVNTLTQRKQLWILPINKIDNELIINRCVELLENIYGIIENY